MPERELAARRYARAAFEIARDAGALEKWSEELGLIANVVGYPEIGAFLESVSVPIEVKYGLIEDSLSDLDPLVRNLAKLLVTKGRIGITQQVLDEYNALVDEARGVAHAVVTTAVPLDEDEQRAVGERLSEITAKAVTMEMIVDPSIIGGLVARVGDTLIDGSVRTRLLNLKRQLKERDASLT